MATITAVATGIPGELLQELVDLRIRLSALRITAVTEALLSAINSIINDPEPGAGYDLEVVDRLAHTARTWLGQEDEHVVPPVYNLSHLVSCMRPSAASE